MTSTLPGISEGEEDECCYDQPGQPSQHVGGPPAPATHISTRDVDTYRGQKTLELSMKLHEVAQCPEKIRLTSG